MDNITVKITKIIVVWKKKIKIAVPMIRVHCRGIVAIRADNVG